nr:mediator of RNA polymerase II transcription subunit 15-like [Bactrocera oleae]
MNCAYICYLSLCIGTALAVLYNGEAPKPNAETVVGGLQQQHTLQQQERLQPLTLPGYHYSGPAATAQQAFNGYRYSAPAATATETTTTTTTVRPSTTAAPTQPAAIGYIYNKPLAESYNGHTYFDAPHYQQSQQTLALAVSSDADVRQQLPLSAAHSYYVPQSEVVNSGHFDAMKPKFFVQRIVAAATEAPQTLTQTAQVAKEQRNDDAIMALGYNYAHPTSDAEMTADAPASYQQAFQQFADYLIWQRAQSKQQEQTQTEEKQQQHTIPHTTQAYDGAALQEFNFPSAQRQYESAIASSLIQATPQAASVTFARESYAPAAAVPANTVAAPQATNLLASAPAPTLVLVERRPLSNGVLLSGERFTSKHNTAEYYIERPSESFELPTYSTMEMASTLELSSNHDQSASQSYAQSNAEKLAQQSSDKQVYHNNVAQANAPYFYEPAKQFAQTAQHPLQLQQQRDRPTQQAYVMQEQSLAAAAQQKESLAKAQQQSQQLVSAKKLAQTFAQLATDATKTQKPQPNDAWFAKIPQWPQNVALQVQQQQQLSQQRQQPLQQQQPLYSRFVKPLGQTAHELGQLQSIAQQQYRLQQQHQLQQQQQSKKQNNYPEAQSQPRPQSQSEPLTSAAADTATILEHSSQRFTQSTQPSQVNTPTADSNDFFNFDSTHFRHPHSTYGVPSENTKAGGYNYQRPVGH